MTEDPKSASTLLPTVSYGGQRLLSAVGTPFELDGAALAARQIRNHVFQAVKAHGAVIPAEWSSEAAMLYDTLRRAAEQGQSHLKTLPESSRATKGYKDFTSPRTSNVTFAAASRIDAALGVIIVAEASIARTVSPLVIAAHHTLHHAGVARSGRHLDWSNLLSRFPTTIQGIEEWEKRDTEPGIRAFMAALASALRSPPLAPGSLVVPGTAADGGLSPAHTVITGAKGGKNRPPSPAQAVIESEEREPPKSLVGWLRGRADQAGYLSRWGVEGRWERQTKAELTAVCKGIRVALEPGHPDRTLAFFATVSLATSLPARRASELKLSRNTDLWMDLHLGAVRWYLQRLLNSERAETLSSTSIDDQDLVEIWLPAAAAAVGLELVQTRAQARDILELLTGSATAEAREEFLERYRAWLRSLGYASLHGVEDARFGRSMGQFYRDQSGDVVAALLNLDFEEVAIGTLHYVRLDRSFLHSNCDLAWRRVGLGPAIKLGLPDSPIGSRRALAADEFVAALGRWEIEEEKAVQATMSAATAHELIQAWYRLVHLRLLATITLSAGRGERLSRLTWAAVFGHARYMLLRDKDTDDYSQTRMIPIVRALRTILDDHAHDLRLFCRRAADLGLRVETPNGRRFGERAPHRVCFYSARVIEHPDGAYLSRATVDSEFLQKQLCKEIFGREINVGRHSLVTLAVRHGFEPALIKVMTGHVRGQAEPFSDGQWIAPVDALQLLSDAMEWVLRPLLPPKSPRAGVGVLMLNEWTSRLPTSVTEALRSGTSRGRVLAEPFTAATTLAVRAVDHLRHLVSTGQGPSDPGARLLAAMLLIQWVSLTDAHRAWELDTPFRRIGRHCSALVMQREGCRAEIRRPMVGPAALALHDVHQLRPCATWFDTLARLGDWIRYHLPAIPWPRDGVPLAFSIDTLITLWMRVHLPPFLLTAASPQISAPTATRASVLRLLEAPRQSRDGSCPNPWCRSTARRS